MAHDLSSLLGSIHHRHDNDSGADLQCHEHIRPHPIGHANRGHRAGGFDGCTHRFYLVPVGRAVFEFDPNRFKSDACCKFCQPRGACVESHTTDKTLLTLVGEKRIGVQDVFPDWWRLRGESARSELSDRVFIGGGWPRSALTGWSSFSVGMTRSSTAVAP